MIGYTDIQRVARGFWPKHAIPNEAAGVIANMFRGLGVDRLAQVVASYFEENPDSTKPEWKTIRRLMASGASAEKNKFTAHLGMVRRSSIQLGQFREDKAFIARVNNMSDEEVFYGWMEAELAHDLGWVKERKPEVYEERAQRYRKRFIQEWIDYFAEKNWNAPGWLTGDSYPTQHVRQQSAMANQAVPF